MKLKTDDQFRLRSKVLFKAKTSYDVEKQCDGSIVIRELHSNESELAKPRKYRGVWMGANIKLDKEALLRAINDDRECIR